MASGSSISTDPSSTLRETGPDDYFLYVNKYTTGGKPWHTISWNANYEAEAAYRSAQWNLGEDLQFGGEEDLSSFTLSNDPVKLEVKPIPSFKQDALRASAHHQRLCGMGKRPRRHHSIRGPAQRSEQ